MKINWASLRQKTEIIFQKISDFLKALWIFLPGIIFIALGLVVFTTLSQGKDVIYQSADPIREHIPSSSWSTALYMVLASIFWVFTTWYTSRMIAYNHEDQNQKTPWMLNHFPRLTGYAILLVLWLAIYLVDDYENKRQAAAWAFAVVDLAVYVVLYYTFDNLFKRMLNEDQPKQQFELARKKLFAVRWVVRALIIASCVVVVFFWRENSVKVLLSALPVFQICFLFLVVARYPLYRAKFPDKEVREPPRKQKLSGFFNRYMQLALWKSEKNIDLQFERPVFIFYHVFALAALICYFLSINSVSFARELKSFPVVLLAFGILVGFINLIALFSKILSININFFLLLIIVIAGAICDPHTVRLFSADNATTNIYDKRIGFRQYADNWVRTHIKELDTAGNKTVPMFFILADGGASRSGYWAASVLARMHEGTRYGNGANSFFMDHAFCFSGASGGGVGNTVFLTAYSLQQKHPELTTTWLSQKFLGSDFLAYPLARMLGPELLEPVFGGIWQDRAYALEHGMDYPADSVSMMGEMMRNSLSALMPDTTNQFPILFINTTRVNDGGPGVVSTVNVEESVFGKRIDVLDSIPAGKDIRISTAMVMGARFPYMSPGGRLAGSYFVDGGYFDNSGAGNVHEVLLELNRMALDSSTLFSKYASKIHYYVIHLANSPYASARVNKPIHPIENDLATPLLTLAGSYDSQTSVNDSRLSNYLKESDTLSSSYIIFNLYTRLIGKDGKDSIVKDHFPMNWVISKRQRDAMKDRAEKKAISAIVERMAKRKDLDSLFHGFAEEN